MLEKIASSNESGAAGAKTSLKYIRFSKVDRYQTGTGWCFVYNAVLKRTKQGKPFVTLYLRDVVGDSIPGYVFDLSSPLFAGFEARSVVGKIVAVDYQENYLTGIGLTFILDKVSVVTGVGPQDLAMFTGSVPDLDTKMQVLKDIFMEELRLDVGLPMSLQTHSSSDFYQGRVGGLGEYYYRVAKSLLACTDFTAEERYNLWATFAIYIFAHNVYVQYKDREEDGIDLVLLLTKNVEPIADKLQQGSSALEVVHMFFGYEPRDIYVRTIMATGEYVQRVQQEFSVYHTIPLSQEGDAGYGKIHRYKIEAGAEK